MLKLVRNELERGLGEGGSRFVVPIIIRFHPQMPPMNYFFIVVYLLPCFHLLKSYVNIEHALVSSIP